MKKIAYTDEAIKDLQRLREFIAKNNPSAANRIASNLISRVKLLTEFPQIGTPVNQAPNPESIRDMFFDKYVVRYSVHTDTVIILRIWHGLESKK